MDYLLYVTQAQGGVKIGMLKRRFTAPMLSSWGAVSTHEPQIRPRYLMPLVVAYTPIENTKVLRRKRLATERCKSSWTTQPQNGD